LDINVRNSIYSTVNWIFIIKAEIVRKKMAIALESALRTTHDPAIMEIVDQIYILEDGKLVENT
jgi:ABC-type lipoprotein export system ATPase subunit